MIRNQFRLALVCSALLVLAAVAGGCSQRGEKAMIGSSESPDSDKRHAGCIIEPAMVAAAHTQRLGLQIIVDVRPLDAFEAGHLANARWLDLAAWTAAAKTTQTGLNDLGYWKRQALKLGIAGNEEVFIYDNGEMTEAARVWFILQLIGVGQAAVVNGGWPVLSAVKTADRIEEGPPPIVSAAFEFIGNAPPLVENVEREGLRAGVQSRRADPILDVRTADEYAGKDKRSNTRAGHLPGAKSLPHKQLLQGDGRMKSPAELRRVFADAGLKPGQRVTVHCQSGGRASVAALALVYSGFAPVDNYYLSFGDWAADVSCPIEE